MSGGDDPDSCLPAPLRDFVFDLHDSARRSQVPSEQSVLYNGTFKELSAKYFATSAWPSPESISSDCNSDPLFLALYRELTQRHLHNVTRPQVVDRIDGWHVYRSLFDLLLSSSENQTETLYILPEWSFDILHEFVYQFQGFCQFRTQAATKYGSDTLQLLGGNRDAWAVETVLFYLHRLAERGLAVGGTGTGDTSMGAYRHLGLFASVVLSRLECLLGDYRASLSALKPVYARKDTSELINSVFHAKLSLVYHAGVSYLMLRRYKDATRLLGDICTTMQRGFKTGTLRKLPGSSDQFLKLYDRMVALLAILTHICPSSQKLDDALAKTIRDKHGNQLAKIEAGEEGYEDMFMFACPKFVTAAVPDYTQGAKEENGGGQQQDAYRLQVKQFMTEMSQQRTLTKLRSYIKLYTSIKIDKLAAFNDTQEDEFLSRLLCYKHKMRQLESKEDDPLEGKWKMALDIHYYIVGDMIHVGEEQKVRRFDQYFLKGIQANEDIMKEVSAIDTNV